MLKHLFFLSLLILYSSFLLGQEVKEVDLPKEKKVSLVPLPVISGNPTAGLILGAAPSLNWYMGDSANTSMSTALGMILFTTKRQFFSSLRSNAFTQGDRWTFLTDIRFNINNQPTYGLGTKIWLRPENEGQTANPSDDFVREMIFFDHFRFYGTALKHYKNSRFFYGVGYLFDRMYNIDDRALDLELNPTSTTFHYRYQTDKGLPVEEYRQSGVSGNLLFDSRDNIANPYDGQYAFLSWRLFPEWMGSTVSNSQIWLEYRNYFTLNKDRPRNLLAFWTYAWSVTGGEVPYMFLPALGWDMFSRSGRPYTFGRFRGEDLVYGELEWRFPIQQQKDRFGGVLFLNTVSASSRTEDVGIFDNFQFGYGLGLRYMILPKKRINIGLDYGWGTRGASGIFLNVNEVF